MKTSVKRITARFKKFLYWLPVIWNDYDFDQVYFWIIMRHKLKSMRDFFNSERAIGANSKKDAENMDLCIKVLDRIIAENYLDNARMWHDKKWGETQMWTEPVDDECCELKFTRPGIKNEQDKEKERKEFLKWCDVADRQEQQDIEFLLTKIKKYVRRWWD